MTNYDQYLFAFDLVSPFNLKKKIVFSILRAMFLLYLKI